LYILKDVRYAACSIVYRHLKLAQYFYQFKLIKFI
jgi:hypothetical protein